MSFIDTFPGSSPNARWTSVVSGAGSITVANNEMVLDWSSAGSDVAFVTIQLDLSKSQQWWVSAKRTVTNASGVITLQDSASAPTGDTVSNVNARVRLSSVLGTNSDSVSLQYKNAGGTAQFWETTGPSWTTTTGGVNSFVADDYYVWIFEIDREAGANRWRQALIHSQDAAYNFNAGNVMAAMTDWVNFSDTLAISNNLWLVIGDSYNNSGSGAATIEYVRYADGPLQYMYTNQKDSGGAYSIQAYRSLDGRVALPVDRTSGVITGNVKDPWVLDDGGGTYYMWYRDDAAKSIKYATASNPAGPWTVIGTAITPAADHGLNFPAVVYTPWDVHPYQMLYNDLDIIAGTSTVVYAWAATIGGSWTVVGEAIPLGSSGANDDKATNGPVPIHRNGTWEVWYTGAKASDNGQRTGFRATGATLTSLTKDGSSARLLPIDATEALTADLTTNAATVSSTTGFAQWQNVYLKNSDSNDALWNASRIRSISGSTINLSHKVIGYTTGASAKILGSGNGNLQIRAIKQVGSDWWIYATTFNTARYEAASYNIFQEEMSLLIVPGSDLTTMNNTMFSLLDSPLIYRAAFGNADSSVENIALVNGTTAQTSAGTVILMGRGLS